MNEKQKYNQLKKNTKGSKYKTVETTVDLNPVIPRITLPINE